MAVTPTENRYFIEFEVAEPAALSQEWNYTDRSDRLYRAGHRVMMRGFFGDAASVFERATRYDPSHYMAYVGRAEALILLGRDREAAGVVDMGLERYGRNSEIGAGRGHVFLHQGDLHNAMQCADVAMRNAPHSAYVWVTAGELRLALPKALSAAEDCFGRARRAADVWPNLEVRIALALLEWGRVEEAIGALGRVVEGDPGIPLGWILLGDAYRVKGDRRRSRECYARAAELVPTLECVQRALSWKERVADRWRGVRRAVRRAVAGR